MQRKKWKGITSLKDFSRLATIISILLYINKHSLCIIISYSQKVKVFQINLQFQPCACICIMTHRWKLEDLKLTDSGKVNFEYWQRINIPSRLRSSSKFHLVQRPDKSPLFTSSTKWTNREKKMSASAGPDHILNTAEFIKGWNKTHLRRRLRDRQQSKNPAKSFLRQIGVRRRLTLK